MQLINNEKVSIENKIYLAFNICRPSELKDIIKNRNEKCFCGSGKKFKKCCIEKAEAVKKQRKI